MQGKIGAMNAPAQPSKHVPAIMKKHPSARRTTAAVGQNPAVNQVRPPAVNQVRPPAHLSGHRPTSTCFGERPQAASPWSVHRFEGRPQVCGNTQTGSGSGGAFELTACSRPRPGSLTRKCSTSVGIRDRTALLPVQRQEEKRRREYSFTKRESWRYANAGVESGSRFTGFRAARSANPYAATAGRYECLCIFTQEGGPGS